MGIAITVSKELDATDGAHRFVLLPIARREFDVSIACTDTRRTLVCANAEIMQCPVPRASSENN